MTVTDTVTTFAHDAAHAAEDLGKQALQLGRTAVAAGSDVASTRPRRPRTSPRT